MDIKTKAYGICLYKKNGAAVKILLCKSVNSNKRWGFLKGVKQRDEVRAGTAVREFYEESGIRIGYYQLENYFEQENKEKDIGIFLVNFDNIKGIDTFFNNEKLLDKFLCLENSEVRFFDINKLPHIKKKQIKIVDEIVNFFKT